MVFITHTSITHAAVTMQSNAIKGANMELESNKKAKLSNRMQSKLET